MTTDAAVGVHFPGLFVLLPVVFLFFLVFLPLLLLFLLVVLRVTHDRKAGAREGKLFDAIRASIATPFIFTPFEHGGRTPLDGGLVNPVPIGPTHNDTTTLTVAVNLSGPEESRPPPRAPILNGNGYRQRIHAFIDSLHLSSLPVVPAHGIFDIAFASMEAMQNTITRLRLAAYSPDVTVEIPRNACGLFEFWRAEELIALGRERTARAFSAVGH